MWFPCGFVWSTCGIHAKMCVSHVLSEIHMKTHVVHVCFHMNLHMWTTWTSTWGSCGSHVEFEAFTCEPHVFSCVFRTTHVKHTFFHVFHMCSTQNHMEITCEIHGGTSVRVSPLSSEKLSNFNCLPPLESNTLYGQPLARATNLQQRLLWLVLLLLLWSLTTRRLESESSLHAMKNVWGLHVGQCNA